MALNWRPLFYWNEEAVWKSIGTSTRELKARQAIYRLGEHDSALQGWPAHPAYIYGNSRLSCALCVLGSKNDLTNGANHNPELYAHYLELERRGYFLSEEAAVKQLIKNMETHLKDLKQYLSDL